MIGPTRRQLRGHSEWRHLGSLTMYIPRKHFETRYRALRSMKYFFRTSPSFVTFSPIVLTHYPVPNLMPTATRISTGALAIGPLSTTRPIFACQRSSRNLTYLLTIYAGAHQPVSCWEGVGQALCLLCSQFATGDEMVGTWRLTWHLAKVQYHNRSRLSRTRRERGGEAL